MVSHKILDKAVVDQLLARKRNGKTAFERLIPLFELETPGMIEEIVLAVQTKQYDAYRALAHKLKGSASVLGAVELSDLAFEIQQAGAANEVPETVYVSELSPAFERFVKEAKEQY
jgi:HPt (histidine-containing phosphotransfer) domain-containing protein